MSPMPSPPTPSRADDEAALWQRLCAGDEAALVALYRETGGRLIRFVERWSGSRALAEDAVQDVFLAVIDQAGRRGGDDAGGFQPGRGTLRAYLFGMARNAGLRRLRAVRPPPGDGPPAVAQRHDDEEHAVRVALARLDPVFREVVLLCDLEGLRYDEAARALAVPVGTVRSRLARGRARLAEQLAPQEISKTPPPVRTEAR